MAWDWRFSTLLVYVAGYLTVAGLAVCIGKRPRRIQSPRLRCTDQTGWYLTRATGTRLRSRAQRRETRAATGVYYVAEIIEENTQRTKVLLKRAIQATYGVYAVLLVWDRKPFLAVLSGVVAQVAYSRLLTKTFPFVSFSSSPFLASCAALAFNQLMWYRHLSSGDDSLEYAICFCLVTVWLVPFAITLSLASTDGVLPGAPGGVLPQPKRAGGGEQPALYSGGGSRRGLFLQILRGVQATAAPYVVGALRGMGFNTKGNAKRNHYM